MGTGAAEAHEERRSRLRLPLYMCPPTAALSLSERDILFDTSIFTGRRPVYNVGCREAYGGPASVVASTTRRLL